jgi:hypothetical protein
MSTRTTLLTILLLIVAARLIALSTSSSPTALTRHVAHRDATTLPFREKRTELQRTGAMPNSVRKLPVLVDGSRTPDAVPDVIAKRVFVRSLAYADRREAVLMRLQLAAVDRSALLSILGASASRIVEIADQRKALSGATKSTATSEARAALKGEEDQLLDATYSSIVSTLTNSGASKLSQYVHTDVKRRLKGFSVSAAMHH